MSLREGIATAVERVDENLDLDSMFDMEEGEKAMVYQTYTETMHLCYSFGFEVKETDLLIIIVLQASLSCSNGRLCSFLGKFCPSVWKSIRVVFRSSGLQVSK